MVLNEVSRRYVDSDPEFYIPKAWRSRAENVKQGSGGAMMYTDNLQINLRVQQFAQRALVEYQDLLEAGVAPEQARMVLPQNTMTEGVWTGSLVAWARVCRLRLDSHAQAETRDVAQRFDNLLRPAFPVSWPALMGESK
jgi:thymidylate synthase (FAD)